MSTGAVKQERAFISAIHPSIQSPVSPLGDNIFDCFSDTRVIMTRHKNLVGRKASRHHQFFPKTVFTHTFFLTAQTRLYTCCCCCCLFAWLKEKKKKKKEKKEKNLLFDYYKLLISCLAQMTLLCPIDVETPIELALLATRIAIKVINNPLRKCLLHNFVVHSLFLLY